jgi:hypothetical protein
MTAAHKSKGEWKIAERGDFFVDLYVRSRGDQMEMLVSINFRMFCLKIPKDYSIQNYNFMSLYGGETLCLILRDEKRD